MPAKKTTAKLNSLYRSETDRVIGGVCAGLAHFFNIDPTLVRLIFVLITVFGGSGVLLYLVLWLVIPSQSHQGNISKENIRQSADEMKDKAEKFVDEAKEFTKSQNSKALIGIVVLILGFIFLFQNFGFFRFFDFGKLWPIILIILGYIILTKRNE